MLKKTKAESLNFIKKKINFDYLEIPKFIFMSKIELLNNFDYKIKYILRNFSDQIIIRSSNQDEDQNNITNAGKYKSVVCKNKKNEVTKEISKFVSKIKNKDQVLVQDFIKNVDLSGVVFTRDLKDNSPYLVINFDTSRKTNLVTSGKMNPTMETMYIHRSYKYFPIKFKNLINIIIKLEKLFKNNRLDIEFCIKNKKIYLLQCRKLPKNKQTSELVEELINIEKKIDLILNGKSLLPGTKNILSNMADWNPAEMIGNKPYPLSISLYKELITDEQWAIHRSAFGYKDVRPNKLMYNIGGSPFIDVRTDLNSFLPAHTSLSASKKIINKNLNFLIKNPEFHDKIEFNTVQTFYNIFKKTNYDYLEYKENQKQINYQKKILNNFFDKKQFKKDKNNIKKLISIIKKIESYKTNEIQKINWHIFYLKKYGIIPFSNMARRAFIAIELINTLCDKKLINEDYKTKFFGGIKTTISYLNKELAKYKNNEITKKDLLTKFGHLRPSTYDIDSKNYSENFQFYFENSYNYINKKIRDLDPFIDKNKIDKFLHNYKFKNKDFLKYLKQCIQERESFKLDFTKSIDLIFKNLRKFSISNKIKINNLKFLDISTIINAETNLSLRKLKKIINDEISVNEYNYNLFKIIKLPDVIINKKDIYFFKKRKSKINFTSNKKIEGKIFYFKKDYSLSLKTLTNKIILIENADPGYDFIFSHGIKGLITKYGGPNSHMSIRCEELNITAAIGIGDLFEKCIYLKSIIIDSKKENLILV
mgnify:CR=1 FL=1|tara:strand:- start:35308 stop:37596 length:2289 start_codon:yes stop_codon:yes gene_type:complete